MPRWSLEPRGEVEGFIPFFFCFFFFFLVCIFFFFCDLIWIFTNSLSTTRLRGFPFFSSSIYARSLACLLLADAMRLLSYSDFEAALLFKTREEVVFH